MNKQLSDYSEPIKNFLHELPSAILLVGEDFTIVEMNPAAKEMFPSAPENAIEKLCGENLCCYHALKSQHGCGSTESCKDCVIRNSVMESAGGTSVHKAPYSKRIILDDKETKIDLLVTTFPFIFNNESVVVLVLDDVTELTTLKKWLPICANCKDIRDDKGSWHQIESYLREHTEAEFSHSICPDCAKELYPDIYQSITHSKT